MLSLTKCKTEYMVTNMKLSSLDEVEIDDPDEMEQIASEAWQEEYAEAIPKAHAMAFASGPAMHLLPTSGK